MCVQGAGTEDLALGVTGASEPVTLFALYQHSPAIDGGYLCVLARVASVSSFR